LTAFAEGNDSAITLGKAGGMENNVASLNTAEQRHWVLASLSLARFERDGALDEHAVLEVALALAAEGMPLPPVGFVADVLRLALGDSLPRIVTTSAPPQWPLALARDYEDRVLGRLLIAAEMDRASEVLRREAVADRSRVLVYLFNALALHLRLPAAEIEVGVLRELRNESLAAITAEAFAIFEADAAVIGVLKSQHEAMGRAFRARGELLEAASLASLENGTAKASVARQVAIRQVLRCMAQFEAALPAAIPVPRAGRRALPTRLITEDHYPVGGYASIGNRGSIESLLHSQLAYMEPEGSPDLFDVKFVRDELFYYTRDENQFRRRRRSIVFAMLPEMAAARIKDRELPVQRGILAFSMMLTAVKVLIDWLSTDALTIEIALPAAMDDDAANAELILAAPIARGDVVLRRDLETWTQIAEHCRERSRVAEVQAAIVCTTPEEEDDDVYRVQIMVNGPRPVLFADETLEFNDDDALDAWQECLKTLLESLI
jgi:hypothetical protein